MKLGQRSCRVCDLRRTREVELVPFNEREQGPESALFAYEWVAGLGREDFGCRKAQVEQVLLKTQLESYACLVIVPPVPAHDILAIRTLNDEVIVSLAGLHRLNRGGVADAESSEDGADRSL